MRSTSHTGLIRRFGHSAHPIGAKGVGESPNVNDAFAHLGLTHTAMPHDHWRVWRTAQSLGLTDAALLGLLVGVRGFEPPAPASRKAMIYFADSIDSEFPLTTTLPTVGKA